MIRTVAPAPLIPAYRPVPGLGATLRRWIAVSRQRRALASLDADALADIGLSAAEARREAARPFWDVA
jgi:uncharacterized protein YjiS (DUF1127 family)